MAHYKVIHTTGKLEEHLHRLPRGTRLHDGAEDISCHMSLIWPEATVGAADLQIHVSAALVRPEDPLGHRLRQLSSKPLLQLLRTRIVISSAPGGSYLRQPTCR